MKYIDSRINPHQFANYSKHFLSKLFLQSVSGFLTRFKGRLQAIRRLLRDPKKAFLTSLSGNFAFFTKSSTNPPPNLSKCQSHTLFSNIMTDFK